MDVSIQRGKRTGRSCLIWNSICFQIANPNYTSMLRSDSITELCFSVVAISYNHRIKIAHGPAAVEFPFIQT